MSSGCNARISAQAKSDALWGPAFLEHDADGVNDFLVPASVATRDSLLAPKRGSGWRPHVTIEHHHAARFEGRRRTAQGARRRAR
jgi:hypothetical protein